MARRKSNSGIWAYLWWLVALIFIALLFSFDFLKIPSIQNDKNKDIPSPVETKTWHDSKNQEEKIIKKYYKWDKLTVSWTVYKIDYNLNGWYQNKLTTESDEFYLKSENYILNDFADKKVSVEWEISNYASDNTAVLNIIKIDDLEASEKKQETDKDKKDKDEHLNQEELSVNKDKYISKNWITIDLTWTEFSAKSIWSWIEVYKNLSWDNEVKIATISPYTCKEWSNLYDCKKFKNERAKTFNYATSTNDAWVTFYKMSETSQYVIIWEKYGYNIFPSSDEFLKVLNFIKLEDFQAKTEELIKNTCKNNKIDVFKILDIENKWTNYIVTAFDQNSNKVRCELTIKWDSQMIWQLISLKYTRNNVNAKDSNKNSIMAPKTKDKKPKESLADKKKTEVNKDKKTEVKKELETHLEDVLWEWLDSKQETTNTNEVKKPAQSPETTDTATWSLNDDDYLIFKSKWYPYTLYMPKSVRYSSSPVQEDFAVSWLSCKQVTSIADWKTWDLSDPNLQVYYCKSSLSSWDIKWFLDQMDWNFQVRAGANKVFVIKYKSDDISMKMLNYLKTF